MQLDSIGGPTCAIPTNSTQFSFQTPNTHNHTKHSDKHVVLTFSLQATGASRHQQHQVASHTHVQETERNGFRVRLAKVGSGQTIVCYRARAGARECTYCAAFLVLNAA